MGQIEAGALAAPVAAPLANADYQLGDNFAAEHGSVFLTGTQALVRLLMMQARADRAAGLNTAGFVSGYRGSPLGMVDQTLWKAADALKAHRIDFLPAINEDLAGATCLGTQQVESDPQRTADGVFALWYGKGPGVDRSGDALRHGNVSGSSPHGGVLVVLGDDHGCVSSSMPHQSDMTMAAWGIPVLHPANVAEYLEFGLYGWALSRFSGCWVGFKAISEVVESGMTVDLDRVPLRFEHPVDYNPPAGGLHYRPGDVPSPALELRLAEKHAAVLAFARENSIDQHVVVSPAATLGIVTTGKAHYDFLEVLRRLDLSLDELAAAGVRIYKLGLVWPIEPTRMIEFARGLTDILVIEEKGPLIERQIKDLLYDFPRFERPLISGKTDAKGSPLLPSTGELRPSKLMPVIADWLARLNPVLDRRDRVRDFTMPQLLANRADAVRRIPYFCAGCPHSSSTKVPEGSRAQTGIGCHYMAAWMNRNTAGYIHMGAEGVDWVGRSRFTREPHIFQNLGDGTYYHSGYLAIRQAIAAKARMTFKILCNDAVAMTGGQPVDGPIGVAQIARQVEAEGARRVVVVSDDAGKHRASAGEFPKGTTFHPREALDAVQRQLRDADGVTVLIFEQTCAAEKRRRRKRQEFPDPPRRVFINEAVCEGCGDCGEQSNCLAVIPVETLWGRKRQIDQTACNKDFSCLNGFCPSFVTVHDPVLRQREALPFTDADFERERAALPPPPEWRWTGPFDLLVTGVGGTGVVTVGAVITMAAHLEGRHASVLDFMGFAQKGGAVLSHVRLSPRLDWLNQVRIDTQQADALLACDLVVGASSEALQTVKHGRTVILASRHENPTAAFVRDPNAQLQTDALLDKMRFAAGNDRVHLIDAQALALDLLGDTQLANVLMLGYGWQHGLVPVSLAALERAVELNGVAVAANKRALTLGRLACADPSALQRLAGAAPTPGVAVDPLTTLRAECRAHLTAYQNAGLAERHAAFVDTVLAAEAAVAPDTDRPLTRAVAQQLARLLAVKDEYEVARLLTAPAAAAAMGERFAGWSRLTYHLALPFATSFTPDGQRPKKRAFGGWITPFLKLLAAARVLRGTPLDLINRTAERRTERALAGEYEALIQSGLAALTPTTHAALVERAESAAQIRGYGPVKAAAMARVRAQWQAWRNTPPASASINMMERPRAAA